MRMLMTAALIAVAGCGADDASGGGDFEDATLVEGRGVEPSLLVGTTTLSQAGTALDTVFEPTHLPGAPTEVSAGPLRLIFVPHPSGGEPVLHHIWAPHIPNPNMPQYTGTTGRGIKLLDSVEQMQSIYGAPAATQSASDGNTIFYYRSGAVFHAIHPGKISGYSGPEPTPTSLNIVRITVTPPFDITGGSAPVSAGQLQLTMPPKTTLRMSVD